jgi:hypothetical protein
MTIVLRIFRVIDFIKGEDCNLVSTLRDSHSDHLPVEVFQLIQLGGVPAQL